MPIPSQRDSIGLPIRMSKKQTLDDEISLISCAKASGINQVRDEVNLVVQRNIER